jgi:hypothetical protein
MNSFKLGKVVKPWDGSDDDDDDDSPVKSRPKGKIETVTDDVLLGLIDGKANPDETDDSPDNRMETDDSPGNQGEGNEEFRPQDFIRQDAETPTGHESPTGPESPPRAGPRNHIGVEVKDGHPWDGSALKGKGEVTKKNLMIGVYNRKVEINHDHCVDHQVRGGLNAHRAQQTTLRILPYPGKYVPRKYHSDQMIPTPREIDMAMKGWRQEKTNASQADNDWDGGNWNDGAQRAGDSSGSGGYGGSSGSSGSGGYGGSSGSAGYGGNTGYGGNSGYGGGGWGQW